MFVRIDKYLIQIDEDEAWRLKKYNYRVNESHNRLRVRRKKNGKHFYLHREITNCPDGFVVDHINMDTLNNKKDNLRICSVAENNRNRRKLKTNKTGFKGVCWHKQEQKYVAQIFVNSKHIHIGSYGTPQEAYSAYCKAARKYHGAFARVN